MDVGARQLGMPDGMLTRLVGERLYWKIVITFQISEPRGGKPQQPHVRMPPPHFTVLYMRAPCEGYPSRPASGRSRRLCLTPFC